jgi:uncharacterized protein
MLLDITRLRTAPQDVHRQIPPEEFADLKEEFRVVGPTDVVGTVRRDKGTTVILDVRVSSVMEMTCSRCVEPFTVPVYANVRTRFVPPAEFAKVTAETAASDGKLTADEEADEMSEGDSDDAEEVVGIAEYRDDKIDLTEVVREQLYLALPMKPLCREDCKGLCPVCGVNRNRETCTCQETWVDPRMAALKQFKTRNE